MSYPGDYGGGVTPGHTPASHYGREDRELGAAGHGFSLDYMNQLLPAKADPFDKIFAKISPKKFNNSEWWVPSYLFDWILFILLGIIMLIMVTTWDPYERPYQSAVRQQAPTTGTNGVFSFNDNEFMFAYNEDTFSMGLTTFISLIVPLLIYIIFAAVLKFVKKVATDRVAHELHHAFYAAVVSVMLTYLAWIPINKSAGSFRPDFWERLNGGAKITGGDETLIKRGREAFPSGHTAMAFQGLSLLSLWSCGKLKTFHSTGGQMWKIFVCIVIPMIFACAQAVTRVTDNRHRTVDILAGAVLGGVCAFIGYHSAFPGVTAPDCDRPKNRKWFYPKHLNAGIPGHIGEAPKYAEHSYTREPYGKMHPATLPTEGPPHTQDYDSPPYNPYAYPPHPYNYA